MPIVTCECGKKYQIREDLLGHSFQCTDCKKEVKFDFWNCLQCNARNPVGEIACYKCKTPKPQPVISMNQGTQEPLITDDSLLLSFGHGAAYCFAVLSVIGILVGIVWLAVDFVPAIVIIGSSISSLVLCTATIAAVRTLTAISRIERRLK